jgi:uncharacterized protein
MAPCPICAHAVAPRPQNKAFPFCSTRCKQVDLGNWLDERYRVEGSDVSPDDADPTSSGDQA